MRHLAGIGERLRPEEIEEFLCLPPEERRALASMTRTPDHPLWGIRRTFASDKLFANAAMLEGGRSDVERVFLVQELLYVFEEEILPWTEEQLAVTPLLEQPAVDPASREAAGRRLFLHRVRSSGSRVYGRIDRVLHSLASDRRAGKRSIVVVDASRSPDPFLVILASPPLPQSGSGGVSPGVVAALAERLASEGWRTPALRSGVPVTERATR
jgi:hypothetical protein